MSSAYTAYARLEKAIAAADAGSIRQRWEYGRRILCDPAILTPAGNLRNGVMGELIATARKAGRKLSEREIRYRMAAARAYPCESQIRHAGAGFETWTTLREAGFPAVEADDGDEHYDPVSVAEKARHAERQLALGEPDQLPLFELFPGDQFSELSTVAELRKYAAESAEWTARHARRDAERFAYIDTLSDAVAGDESKTWAEAQAALDAKSHSQ
jgi:hypothetical protein